MEPTEKVPFQITLVGVKTGPVFKTSISVKNDADGE
jgi:hypothetical protein